MLCKLAHLYSFAAVFPASHDVESDAEPQAELETEPEAEPRAEHEAKPEVEAEHESEAEAALGDWVQSASSQELWGLVVCTDVSDGTERHPFFTGAVAVAMLIGGDAP